MLGVQLGNPGSTPVVLPNVPRRVVMLCLCRRKAHTLGHTAVSNSGGAQVLPPLLPLLLRLLLLVLPRLRLLRTLGAWSYLNVLVA